MEINPSGQEIMALAAILKLRAVQESFHSGRPAEFFARA